MLRRLSQTRAIRIVLDLPEILLPSVHEYIFGWTLRIDVESSVPRSIGERCISIEDKVFPQNSISYAMLTILANKTRHAIFEGAEMKKMARLMDRAV